MLRILKSKGVKMISPQELQFLLDGDSSSQPLIIDIRPTSEYDKGFITGAINVPFYKPIEGWSPFKIARRLGFAAFGVSGTEPNSEFESQVLSAVKGKGSRSIVIYCLMGGSLDQVAAQSIPNLDDQASIQRVKKLQTRSMVAAYQLVDVAGLDAGVSILSGGYSGWASGGRSVSMMVDE